MAVTLTRNTLSPRAVFVSVQTYFERSIAYFDVPLPDPSSAASSDTLASPPACATLSALAPELNTTGPATVALAKRQL